MHYLNNKKKKNNAMLTTATLLMLAFFLVASPATIIGINRSADAFLIPGLGGITNSKAPVVVSGGNIYVAWWTNNTENGNEEVMFRASNDGGATFGDKMNLSNSPDADSWRVEIAGEGADVVVSWWETNQTSDTPVARISTDGGQTFGPMLRLATNGTISSTEEGAVTTAEEGEEELLPNEEVVPPTEEEA
jgi:hypothetical protein